MPGIVDILRLGAAPDAAKVLCLFVHGRSLSPEDMEAAVIRRLSTPDVAFALPRAGDKSWYTARAVDALTETTRAELAASLADLEQLIDALRAEAPGRALVLAGFSQGACLSLEHLFGGKSVPDAVVALTGSRVGTRSDTRAAALVAGMPVYLTAGSDDPWIPLASFAEAAVELGRGGAALRMDVFAGRPHEMSFAEVAMLDGILSDLAAGQAPRFEVAR